MGAKRQFGTIVKRGDRYHVQIRHEGRRVQRSAGRTRREADRKLGRLEAALADGMPFEDALGKAFGGGPSGMSFKQGAALYLQMAERDLAPGTFRAYRGALRSACRAPFAAKPVRTVSTADLERWLEDCRAEGAEPSTLNRHASAVSSAFRAMKRLGHVATNPARDIERQSEKGRERVEYLSEKEAVALLASCESDYFRAAVATGLLCGLRRGEIISLRRRHVDFGRKQLIVEAASAKSRKARALPIPEALVSQLDALLKARRIVRPDGEDPLFASPEGRALTVDLFDNAFRRAVNACDKIPKERKALITPHTLRRTFATWGVRRTGNLFAVSKLLGHSSPDLTARHYARFAPSDGRPVVDAVALTLHAGQTTSVRNAATS